MSADMWELTPDLRANLNEIKKILEECSDVVYREFVFAQNDQIRVAIIYTDGMADKAQIGDIVKAFTLEIPLVLNGRNITRTQALEFIMQRGICRYEYKQAKRLNDITDSALSGEAVLLVDGHSVALVIGTRGWSSRNIEEPTTEVVVRGPRESFVETLQVNLSLLRRRIRNPQLKIKRFRLGQVTRTDVAVAYIKGIAGDGLVREVESRLKRIQVDGILESGYIEEFIQDSPWSPFPTVNHTERPDKVAALLLEGRVAIMVDSTPIVLTVPNLFIEYLQSSEDYYERHYVATAVRMVRFIGLVVSLVLPSFYIAITSFHPQLLPTQLLLSIAAQHEATPFPTLVGIFAMEFVFEILREAGIRLPRAIGQAVSIVGALVIGEAAVRAGLMEPFTIIVVALTGISSFTYSYSASFAFRILKFPLMALSGTLGLLGLVGGGTFIVAHMVTLRSFGVPYLSPAVPVGDLKDTLVRVPWWSMFKRPKSIGKKNPRRLAPGLKPAPPPDSDNNQGGESK